MVEYKIEWATDAKSDLYNILVFYVQRNKSTSYSNKLNTKINKSINLISSNPLLGTKTDYDSVRALITGEYQIIYEVFDQLLLIIMIWDCRRDPNDKRLGRRIK